MNPGRCTLHMILFKIFTRCGARTSVFRLGPHATTMAKALTGSFFLTATAQLPAATASSGRVMIDIDIGSYVSPAQGLAIAVTEVDWIYQQGTDFGSDPGGMVAGNASIMAQLTDLNPGTAFIRADGQSLIASGSMSIDQPNNIASHVSDLYPDNFGPAALSEAFLVVNDNLFVVAGVDGNATGANTVFVTARIRCQVVKVSARDWQAIAIQSTAQA